MLYLESSDTQEVLGLNPNLSQAKVRVEMDLRCMSRVEQMLRWKR